MEKAFIFDMNGTMIDDMQYHTRAWFQLLKRLGAGLSMEETKWQMYGKGEEMFDRIFGPGRFSDDEVQEMIMQKELLYQETFRPHLRLIQGLETFLQQAKLRNIGLAIGTAAPKTNVAYTLDGLALHTLFPVTVCADDVTASKPDPEVFLTCAERLQMKPENCIVFEDAPKGIEAARNGGMKAIAVTSFHSAEDFEQFDNVLFCIDNYEDARLKELLN